MPIVSKKAKVLDDRQVKKLREWVAKNSNMPERDDLMVLLSFHAGLRASEIAKIDLDAFTDAEGRLSHEMIVDPKIAKKKRGGVIPMTPILMDALVRFIRRYPDATYIAIGSYLGGERMTPTNVRVYLFRLMKKAGFEGASSHSGRRTFITNLARRANNYGSSLRDVQQLARHARLDTTEGYIDTNPAIYGMMASLGG